MMIPYRLVVHDSNVRHDLEPRSHRPGVSNSFSSGARLKSAGAPMSEAKGFTEARSAERGRVGEGVTPSRRWGSGGLPREIFGKLPQNGAFWCILKQ